MQYIGLDIGTTTISGLLVDGISGRALMHQTIPNDAAIKSKHPWERQQDPERIFAICSGLLSDFMAQADSLGGIGLTGQMHGMLYVDETGSACGNLVSWQDERGNLPTPEGVSHCEQIRQITGRDAATGFGLVTLYYDIKHGRIPAQARKICTISDYIGMRLMGRKTPLIHASNAASLGLFQLEEGDFDRDRIEMLGIDPSLLPEISRGECAQGETPDGIPVAVAIGDNQASFLGSVGEGASTLINIGTGSQISTAIPQLIEAGEGLECRPYVDSKYLLNGSGLCGGSAYAILERFFQQVIQEFTGTEPNGLMRLMDALAERVDPSEERLHIDTRFRGTRREPALRGSIQGIGAHNFTPGDLAYSFMLGICEELHNLYLGMPKGRAQDNYFVASGNAVRKSAIERRMLMELFGAPIKIPTSNEEASFGAALMALHVAEDKDWDEIAKLIHYTEIDP